MCIMFNYSYEVMNFIIFMRYQSQNPARNSKALFPSFISRFACKCNVSRCALRVSVSLNLFCILERVVVEVDIDVVVVVGGSGSMFGKTNLYLYSQNIYIL